MNNLNILYEDNHLIVVEKKSNILSQEDHTHEPDLLNIVKGYIKEKYNKKGNVYLGLVHRLDKNVGGIMVFAKTSKAARRLCLQIKNHEFSKTYLALVSGIVNKKSGKLINYLVKDCKNKKSYVKDKNYNDAKEAILYYDVIKYINNNSLLKINLITGRFHQIRVQLSNINHPIIGDLKYGNIKNNNFYLYAYKLEFMHPVTKEKLSFELLPNWKEIKDETIIY